MGLLSGVKNLVTGAGDTLAAATTAAIVTSAVKDVTSDKPAIPVWFYRAAAWFPVTGLIGFDHYLAGSGQSALAKLIVNLLTFGSWYFYDAIYAMDTDILVNQGLMTPFFEEILIKDQVKIVDKLGQPVVVGGTDINLLGFYVIVLASFAGGLWGLNYNHDYRVQIAAYVFTALTIGTMFFTFSVWYTNKAKAAAASVASALKQAAQSGGGRPPQENNDFILLGTLFIVTVCGFALSSARSKSH